MNIENILISISQTALNYIFVTTISSNSQKMTVSDLKTDLRTTKEDLLTEIKSFRQDAISQTKESGKKKWGGEEND